RAGHPHPMYLPGGGPVEVWTVPGTLLGVFETHFTVQTHRLRPGDKVIFYTDGLDTQDDETNSTTTQRLMVLAEQHQRLHIGELVAQLSRDLVAQSDQLDDLTLLGLELV